MPHYPLLAQWVGKGGGLDLVLNEIRACIVGNLIFGLIKSPPSRFQMNWIGGDLIT